MFAIHLASPMVGARDVTTCSTHPREPPADVQHAVVEWLRQHEAWAQATPRPRRPRAAYRAAALLGLVAARMGLANRPARPPLAPPPSHHHHSAASQAAAVGHCPANRHPASLLPHPSGCRVQGRQEDGAPAAEEEQPVRQAARAPDIPPRTAAARRVRGRLGQVIVRRRPRGTALLHFSLCLGCNVLQCRCARTSVGRSAPRSRSLYCRRKT